MISTKHKEIFELLYSRTKSGDLAWHEAPERGTFVVSFTSYSLELSAYWHDQATEESDPIFRIMLRNDSGDVIETFDDTDVGEMFSAGAPKTEFYKKTKELYALAQRTALGTDKALDAVLKELKDIIPF